MSTLPRGVHRSAVLSKVGHPFLVAVDYRGWLVDYVEVADPTSFETITAHLWDVLDAADPDHARRETPRVRLAHIVAAIGSFLAG